MGSYYNPPAEIHTLGRLLVKGSFDSLMVQLKPGELLFSMAEVFHREENPLSALHLDCQQTDTDSRAGARQGLYNLLGYYALRREDAEKKMGILQTEEHFPIILQREEFDRIAPTVQCTEIGNIWSWSAKGNDAMQQHETCIQRLTAHAKSLGGSFAVIRKSKTDWRLPRVMLSVTVYTTEDD